MDVKATVTFVDKAEAARWLACYYSEAGTLPRAVRDEFPWEPRGPVYTDVIEDEAIRLLVNCKDGCGAIDCPKPDYSVAYGDRPSGEPACPPVPVCRTCGARYDMQGGWQPPPKADAQALDAIHVLLDGKEWEVGTIEEVAELVAQTGRKVREPIEEEDQCSSSG